MKIIAYTYEAAMHCPGCTAARFPGGPHLLTDEHGVSMYAIDRECNQVHPVYSTDETNETHCDTCRGPF